MGSQSAHEGGVHVIYPGGDTIFLCGPKKVKLLVHSIFLTNASRVFAAMLGPLFREGQPQTHSGPREIPLPEDDPFSMEVIFSIIHSRREYSDETISSKQLLSIAYAADKYDLVSTMKYASSYWFSSIQTLGHSFQIEIHLDSMKAAYLFENADAFHVATSAIILGYIRPFSGLRSHFEDIMPQETILILEEKRNKLRLDIIQLLWPQGDIVKDQWGQIKTREWLDMIQTNSLLPRNIVSSSLTGTITSIQNACKSEKLQANGIFMTSQSRLRFLTELNELKRSAGIYPSSLRNRN